MSDVTRRSGPVVLVPAYNAGSTVGDVVAGFWPKVCRCWWSTTVAVMIPATRPKPLVRPFFVIRKTVGKGAAIQTGFAYAQKLGASALLTMDADGQHDTAELENLFAAHKKQPDALIIGVRSFDPQVMPRRSRIGNRIRRIDIAVRQASAPRYPVGLSHLSAAALSLPLRTRRFDTETEILLWAAKLHIPLVEIPIATIYHGEHRSHFRNWGRHAAGDSFGFARRRGG